MIPLTSLKLFQINTGVMENNVSQKYVIVILWSVSSDIYSCIMSGIAKISFLPHLQFTENQSRSYIRESERKTRSGSRDTHARASASNSAV